MLRHPSVIKTFGRGAATTWNPADKNASITLSAADLTADSAGGTSKGIRTIARNLIGKYYFEITLTSRGASTVGISNSSYSLSAALGADTNGVGYELNTGAVVLNSSTLATWSILSDGNVLGIAVDLTNKLLWSRVNGGSWQGASGSPDPIMGTLGVDFSGIAAGPYFISTEHFNTTTHTLNSRGSAFRTAAPSGFGVF